MESAWPSLERLGLRPAASPERLRVHSDLDAALEGVQFVQENGPEDRAVKVELFEAFDHALPRDAVVATSSSGLLLSDLQEGRTRKERYVLGHPFNPPYLLPLVEVLGGRDTSAEVVDWALDFYNAHGKRAIRLNKEVPGHLVNRLQAALWREAIDAVASGPATVEDVDTAIGYGPGLRWALMGPHLVWHLAGGPQGMRHFMEHLGPAVESWWSDMRHPDLTPDVTRLVIDGCEAEAAGRSVETLGAERDELLLSLLETLTRERVRLAGVRT